MRPLAKPSSAMQRSRQGAGRIRKAMQREPHGYSGAGKWLFRVAQKVI